MSIRAFFPPITSLCLLLTATQGCGSSDPVGACSSAAGCGAAETCVDARCVPRVAMDAGGDAGDAGPADAAPPPVLVSLSISPADATITSVDGAMVTVGFQVEATFDDGTTSAISAAFWSESPGEAGSVDTTSGIFTANGDVGGVEMIQVQALGMTATTRVTVDLERNVLGDGVPTDAPGRFGAELDDPARRPGLLYPLDDTLMPQNVFPPDVQWERGDPGDLFRVTLTAPRAIVRGYVIHSGSGFGYDWAVPRDAWRSLAESNGGQTVTLKVDRWVGATSETVGGVARPLRIAAASITGAIYYWDLGSGRILRIRGDGSGRESFLPNPPARSSDGQRCIACHTVSRDGRHMAAEIWDASSGFGAVYDLTADLSGDPPPAVVAPSATQWLTSSFNPDASRLIATWRNDLFLVDAATGARVPTAGTPLPTRASAQPEWSPDGASVAYVRNHNGSFWGVDFTASDLGIIPVTGPDSFGPPVTIYPGGGAAVARPSWSPDSQWIAIQQGVDSRSNRGGTAFPASLRIVSADGASVIDLARLNGGAANSYYPTFSPFDEGGFFWLAFFSSRDYGNAQVGTRGTGRRQLWVSAVSNGPAGGADPSNPPYWLPQQDVTHQNMAAFWAEEPCRADGRTCAASGECCSGFCRDVGAGPVCVPPDVPECSMTSESCGTDADCCAGAGTCSANVCTLLG